MALQFTLFGSRSDPRHFKFVAQNYSHEHDNPNCGLMRPKFQNSGIGRGPKFQAHSTSSPGLVLFCFVCLTTLGAPVLASRYRCGTFSTRSKRPLISVPAPWLLREAPIVQKAPALGGGAWAFFFLQRCSMRHSSGIGPSSPPPLLCCCC